MSHYNDERPFEDVMIDDKVEVRSYAGVVSQGRVMRTYNGANMEMCAQVRTGPNEKKDFGVGIILRRL